MKVVVHTPQVAVCEFEVPWTADDYDDADLLERVRADGRVVDSSTIATGASYVYLRGEDDLVTAGRRIAAARDDATAAMDQARRIAVESLDLGIVSEREVATKLGIDRNTVRGWRGKRARSA